MRKTSYNMEPVILLLLFAVYLTALFRMTIFRDSGNQYVNLIPFITISGYLRTIVSGSKIIGISNIIGNIIIFSPFGYMSAALFPKMRCLKNILLSAALFSLLIEVCQYILARGRSDIDDIILNIFGGASGYWLYLLTSRLFKRKKTAPYISALMIAVLCISFISYNNYKFLLPAPVNMSLSTEAPEHEPVAEQVIGKHGSPVDTPIEAPAAAIGTVTADRAEWYLILVNKWNRLPDAYTAELTELPNGQSVDKRIYRELCEMLDAAERDGVYPVVVSGYRTAEKQQSLMDEKIAEYEAAGYSAVEASVKAEAWVAAPGTSEHQLGIAVDINADGIHSTGTEVYEWLGQNAHRFGFIRRYPDDKTAITGVINEPWHYRYVGLHAAAEIYSRGICLEEYLSEDGVRVSAD